MQRRSSDREEIRKRLAGGEAVDKVRKPEFNLQSRFSAAGSNLQVCFMNENANSEDEEDEGKDPQPFQSLQIDVGNPNSKRAAFNAFPTTFSSVIPWTSSAESYYDEETESDFFVKQAKLQAEARRNLEHAKELAKLRVDQVGSHQSLLINRY